MLETRSGLTSDVAADGDFVHEFEFFFLQIVLITTVIVFLQLFKYFAFFYGADEGLLALAHPLFGLLNFFLLLIDLLSKFFDIP